MVVLVSGRVPTLAVVSSVPGKISPSLKATLGDMETGEMLREASDLRDLVRHPGWHTLVRYVGIQAAHVESKGEDFDPVRMAMEIARNPAAAAARLAAAGGEARGLRQFEQLVFGTLRTADELQRRLSDNNDERE